MLYALAMSDFWACMPPFGDSVFLPSGRLLSSLRSECLFLGYACFSLVLLLVVGSVVGRPFPFPVLRLPNCRGTLSPTAFHHGRPVCLLPPPGLLTVSQLSSSRLQLTLPTTVRGVSPAPPFGFRLLASARRLPPLGPLRSSTSPPRLRGSLLLLGRPQASRDRLVPSCPRRLAGLGRPLSGLSRPIPSGRLASPEGFLLYEFRSSGSFPRFLLGPFWVPSGSLRVVFLGLPPTLLRSASSPLPSPGYS